MAGPLYDEVTFVVRDSEGRVVHARKRVRFGDARRVRADLEKEWIFPNYEILELISDEQEYILTELYIRA